MMGEAEANKKKNEGKISNIEMTPIKKYNGSGIPPIYFLSDIIT